MNNEEKKELIDEIQKVLIPLILDLVAICFEACFDGQLLQNKCANSCYRHYLSTLKHVTTLMKDKGYSVHSQYAYKMFPIRQPRFQLVYNERFKDTMQQRDFAIDPVSLKEI